jgi:DNA mismatch repair ATPase MutS
MYTLVEEVRGEVGCMYKVCDYIAELDLIASLAQVSSQPGFVKPSFSSILDIRGARHPVLDHIQQTNSTPNNVVSILSSYSFFFLIIFLRAPTPERKVKKDLLNDQTFLSSSPS